MFNFVRHDLDGFFGLFVDNLVQLLLIVALCGELCGMTGDDARFLYGRILPGAALSILIGNVLYAWRARVLMRGDDQPIAQAHRITGQRRLTQDCKIPSLPSSQIHQPARIRAG